MKDIPRRQHTHQADVDRQRRLVYFFFVFLMTALVTEITKEFLETTGERTLMVYQDRLELFGLFHLLLGSIDQDHLFLLFPNRPDLQFSTSDSLLRTYLSDKSVMS